MARKLLADLRFSAECGVEDGKAVKTIVNLNQEQMTILKLLGPDCEKYYGLQD
jgi:hypothetical protein